MLKRQKSQSRQPLLKSDLFKLERAAKAQGFEKVAGIDEAGRGPLAGPVVAACCLFLDDLDFDGINDSKLLSPKKREQLFHAITTNPSVIYGVGIISHSVIDEINILQATHKAMHEAVEEMAEKPDYLLVDGLQLKHKIPSQKVIKGDRLSQTIMAAAIIAKETRDRIMLDYHQKYPEYGFDAHKGYGTKRHRQALMELGPTPIHRQSFNLIFRRYL